MYFQCIVLSSRGMHHVRTMFLDENAQEALMDTLNCMQSSAVTENKFPVLNRRKMKSNCRPRVIINSKATKLSDVRVIRLNLFIVVCAALAVSCGVPAYAIELKSIDENGARFVRLRSLQKIYRCNDETEQAASNYVSRS